VRQTKELARFAPPEPKATINNYNRPYPLLIRAGRGGAMQRSAEALECLNRKGFSKIGLRMEVGSARPG
jgi:hypothetical protein